VELPRVVLDLRDAGSEGSIQTDNRRGRVGFAATDSEHDDVPVAVERVESPGGGKRSREGQHCLDSTDDPGRSRGVAVIRTDDPAGEREYRGESVAGDEGVFPAIDSAGIAHTVGVGRSGSGGRADCDAAIVVAVATGNADFFRSDLRGNADVVGFGNRCVAGSFEYDVSGRATDRAVLFAVVVFPESGDLSVIEHSGTLEVVIRIEPICQSAGRVSMGDIGVTRSEFAEPLLDGFVDGCSARDGSELFPKRRTSVCGLDLSVIGDV